MVDSKELSRDFAACGAATRYADLYPQAIDGANKSLLDTRGVILAATGREPARSKGRLDMLLRGGRLLSRVGENGRGDADRPIDRHCRNAKFKESAAPAAGRPAAQGLAKARDMIRPLPALRAASDVARARA